MEKKTKDELVQWGLAIGAAHAVKSFNQYAERRLMEKKLEELGEEEFKVWAQKYKKENEKVATMVVNVLKVIAIVGFLAAIIETLMK